MAMFDEISFPSHEGLPWASGPPVVDGYTEPHPGLPTSAWRLEAGYVHGAKFTYDGSGAAMPAAVFRGVKDRNEPFLYLAFDVRFDPDFNNNDRVMIIIRPAYSPQAHTPDERRIDVMPVFTGGGGANAAPADANDLPAYFYRTNKPPRTHEVYKRNGAGGTVWDNVTSTVTNVEVKVSSSEPTPGAKNWTVELKIPTTNAVGTGGGGDWVNISNDFGLYVNMIRVCNPGAGCVGPETIGGFFSTQFTWPFDPANPSANLLTDGSMGGPQPPENWDVDPMKLGRARILAPGAANPARGVKFRNGYLGIGVLSGTTITGTLDLRTVGATQTLVARVFNDHTANPANGVEAEFRIADFGLGPYGNNALWRKTPSTPNPAAAPGPIPIGGMTDVDITSNWVVTTADQTRYGAIWYDQCLWVELSSAAGAFFAESSVRRNLLVKTASSIELDATISGELPDKPADGSGEHDYWLYSVAVPLTPPPERMTTRMATHADVRRDERNVFDELNAEPLLTGEMAQTDKPAASWLWVTRGFWRTPDSLTIDGQKYAIWTNSGSFGTVVHHYLEEGLTAQDVDIVATLGGEGVESTGKGGRRLRLRHGGEAKLKVVIHAGRPDELPEEPEEPEKPEPWWVRILRALIALIRRLLRR